MALRSLITVDVDDSAFLAFQQKFQKFQDVSRVSLGFPPLNGELPSSAGSVDGTVAGIDDEADLSEIVAILEQQRQLLLRLVNEVAAERRGGGKNDREADTGFMPFLRGGVGGAAMLAGAAVELGGQAFGMLRDHAADVTAERMGAREANVGIGAYRSFGVALQPYGLDGDQLLETIADVQANIQDPGNIELQRLGVGENDTAGGALAILRAAREAYQQTRGDPRMLDTVLQQRQLTSFGIGPAEARSLGAINDQEFSHLLDQIQRDTPRFNVSDSTALKWQNLQQSIAQTSAQISAVFSNQLPSAATLTANALGSLTGSATALSAVLTQAFPNLTPGDADKFASATVAAVPAVVHFLNETPVEAWPGIKKFLKAEVSIPGAGAGEDAAFRAWRATHPNGLNPGNEDLSPFSFAKIGAALGMTEDPSGNPDAVSPKGALGLFQIMPQTGALYGINPSQLRDPLINSWVAGDQWSKLLEHYNGDPTLTAAAYNFGEGNLDRLLAAHPKDWQQYLPDETRAYITTSPIARQIAAIQQEMHGSEDANPAGASTAAPATSRASLNTGGTPVPRATSITVTNSTGHDVYIQGRLANR